jgi:outer membrane protein assembly factor BamA
MRLFRPVVGVLLTVRAIAALGMFAWAPAAVSAQDLGALIGQPVVAVRFDVEGVPDRSPALLALSDVRVGEPLRQAAIRSTLAALDALDQYEDVVPVGLTVPGGVEVVFRLVPRHPITRLEVRGETGLPASALRDQIQQRYGGVPTGARVSAVETTAAELLRDAGYLDARIASETVVTHDPEGATLVLTVEGGPLARIGRANVDVRGAANLSPAEVLRRTGVQAGEPFRRRDLESALTALEEDLRERGFYEAQATFQPQVTPDGVVLGIVLDAGPRVELQVQPRGVVPGGDIDDLIPIQRLGSADQDLLEDSRRRIEDALRAQGYWRASAPFTRELIEDERRLVITFEITRGPRFRVDRIDLPAALALPAAQIFDLIDIGAGEVFDERRYTQGLARVADAYRRSGYYAVQIEPAYLEVPGRGSATEAWVVLDPNITEGPQGILTDVFFDASDSSALPETTLRGLMQSRPSEPYVEYDAALDEITLQARLRSQGFRQAQVSVVPGFADEGRAVTLTVAIDPGPQVRIGNIVVVGNEHVSTRAILEEIQLQPGAPAGDDLERAQRRLAELGVFRRVTVRVEEPAGPGGRATVIVNVLESPNTTVGFGGGLEGGRSLRTAPDGGLEDYLELSPRGFFEISRRNLGGRNRSISLFSRVSFRPRTAPGDPVRDGRGFGFTEYRVAGTYRERRAFRSDLDLLVGLTSEQAIRTGFNFIRNGASAEFLRPITSAISWSGRYRLDFTRVFDTRLIDERLPIEDQPLIDRLFPQVRLSILATGLSWDRRNDPLAPTGGTFVTADVEVAARSLGSEVGYVKSFFQASGFQALDATSRTVLAMRGEIGIARGFLRTVVEVGEDGQPILDENGQPVTSRVQDLPASQRFFAGGGTTVRGFQVDRLGVPEILNSDGLSLGGNGLVVLNAELRRLLCSCRTVLGTNLGVVGFVDSGNVFARASHLDFLRLREAAGVGVRYNSPLGPLRFDVGFKLSSQQITGRSERGWEYHLSIGEAF